MTTESYSDILKLNSGSIEEQKKRRLKPCGLIHPQTSLLQSTQLPTSTASNPPNFELTTAPSCRCHPDACITTTHLLFFRPFLSNLLPHPLGFNIPIFSALDWAVTPIFFSFVARLTSYSPFTITHRRLRYRTSDDLMTICSLRGLVT